MVTFRINDRELQAEEGKTILEVALDAGIKIPTLCYHNGALSLNSIAHKGLHYAPLR